MTEQQARESSEARTTTVEAAPPGRVGAGIAEVEKDIILATYVDKLAPSNYTEEAKSALLLEVKQFAQDVCAITRMRRRADRNAEKVLRSHVIDTASFLRNKQNAVMDTVADWSKWIGFTFIGFAVQQWIHVEGEKTISSGSVKWLAVDIIIAAVLIVVGFMIDKPWSYLSNRFRKD
jgi:hypothetical protein